MSTSAGNAQGVVRIVDEPDVVRSKFKTAVTDSGREVRHEPVDKPGISNLLEIMSVATGEPVGTIESRYDGAGYGAFKEDVGEAVVSSSLPSGALPGAARGQSGVEAAARRRCGTRRVASAPTLARCTSGMGFVQLAQPS